MTTTDQGLDRRQLLIGGGAAALALAGAAPARAESPPKRGGRFRLGSNASVGDSHDPGTFGTSGVVNIGLWGAVYNNLTEIAPDGRVVPELAESFEPSKDAKTWSFGLRQGITFHDGKPLDADDVVASINYHRGDDSKSGARGLLGDIDDIKADGKDRVVFTLKSGSADFPVLLTDYHLVIGPSAAGKIDWEKAIGTGGYKLMTHERGTRMTLKRTGQYFKPDRAFFDDVELIGINDTTARMNAVVSGEVDAIGRADIRTLGFLQRYPDIVIDETSGTQHFTLPMLTDVAPFDNLDVRLALKYAIDRKALVQTILRGHGTPGNDSPITPGNRYFAKDIPIREYDPEKARFHLKKAGMEGLKVDLSTADAAFNGAVDTAVLFKEQASKAGIDINVLREPNDGYWTNVWNKKPFCAAFWAGRPTEDWMFSQVYAKGVAWNDTHWSNDRFNALLAEARVELDEDKRRGMYHEMQLIVRDDGGVIIPMYANYVDARNKRVAHAAQTGSSYELDGWKCIERWWMA